MRQRKGAGRTYRYLAWFAVVPVAIAVALAFGWRMPAEAVSVLVYKDPNCGCCVKWIEHLEQAGFEVEARDVGDMAPVKAQWELPRRLQSCHTAVIDGYVVEGHVPVADIRRLLDERPDVRGLTVPGMPMGSPGMEGPRKDPYSVLAIDAGGRTTVFSRH